MSYEAEKFIHNGYTVKIISDDDSESPRGWDNLGVLVCFHNRYNLGDENHGYREEDFNGWQELYDQIVKDHKPAAIVPLRLFDHSGISMSVGSGAHPFDTGGWDSGQVGWAFVSREAALKEFGKKIVTKKVRDMAEKCLINEVEVYDQYLTGDIYGYTIETPDGDDVDSCWGMYGLEYCKEEAISNVPTDPAPVGGESEDEQHDDTLV